MCALIKTKYHRMRGAVLIDSPAALERRCISDSSESAKARLHDDV